MSRRSSRRRSGQLAALSVVALAAAMVSGGRAAADSSPWPANPGWQQYVQGPATPNVAPVAVVRTSGTVTNPGALVSGGSGSTKLTMMPGGPAPVILLDYGKDVGGFPYFTVTAASGSPVLRAAYSEGQQFMSAKGDGGGAFNAGDKSRANSYTVRAPGTITHSLIQGGERFQEITLTSPGSVTISAAGIRFSAYRATANEYQGYFMSSSDELNKIWYAGAYTNQLSMLPPGTGGVSPLPLILDGAKRDRNVWIGDIYAEGPTNYVSLGTNGNEYLKQSLRLLGSHQLSSGFVTGCLAPQTPVHTGPPIPGTTSCYSTSYSLYFTPDLADYYRATGDLAFARQQFPIVQRQLGWNASRLNSLGLLVTDTSDGLDWDWYDGTKTGAVSMYNMLYFRNLTEAAYLARETGQPDLATQYTNKAAALRTAINTTLFNSRTGVYDLSDKKRGTVAQDANAAAVTFGVAPAGAVPGILTKLKSALWGPHGPQPFSADTGYSKLVSPFVSGFELRARLTAGDTTGALQLLSDVWGQMVRPGPNHTGALWENLNPDGTIPKGSTSLAHGWASAPTSELTARVLGARPVGAGYATWIVQPQPGSLTWTVGQVPTPHGPLAVKWGRTSGGGFDMDVTAPNGTSGTIAVPADGPNVVITVNGTSVWDRGTFTAGAGVSSARSDGSYVSLSISAPGTYRVAADR
ncbi:alpha-L-rhamnosidase C-terminal domain-containing protein [Amycolatopsis sp. NPDC026612]|uniref:alpha-L-rhamnosidase-related protein n=1 Tax=Amycolatopsis sp. NPDC026612 TaxID=3155466 RepID=UPI0033F2291F